MKTILHPRTAGMAISTFFSSRRVAGILVAGACAVSLPGLHAQALAPNSTGRNFDGAVMDHLDRLPAADLKRLYLDCESESETGRLGIGGIEACSVVYVELLRRVFGGDFDALLAWSRQQTVDNAEHQLVADPPVRIERP